MFDVSGRLTKTIAIPENIQKFTLNTSGISEGLYNLRFTGADLQLHAKLLIIH